MFKKSALLACLFALCCLPLLPARAILTPTAQEFLDAYNALAPDSLPALTTDQMEEIDPSDKGRMFFKQVEDEMYMVLTIAPNGRLAGFYLANYLVGEEPGTQAGLQRLLQVIPYAIAASNAHLLPAEKMAIYNKLVYPAGSPLQAVHYDRNGVYYSYYHDKSPQDKELNFGIAFSDNLE